MPPALKHILDFQCCLEKKKNPNLLNIYLQPQKPLDTFSGQGAADRRACLRIELISVIMMGIMSTWNSLLIAPLGESP